MDEPRTHRMTARSARLQRWLRSSRSAAVAVVLIGATLVSTPAPAGAESAPQTPLRVTGASSSPASWSEQRMLGRSLATEYAGAVPAVEVRALVLRVTAQLQREASPSEHLMRTVEAVCRRALTDYLARGTSLTAA